MVVYITIHVKKTKSIKQHYNIINKNLKPFSGSLTIEKIHGGYIPRWRQELEISSPSQYIKYEDLEYHLKKDFPGSIENIQDFIKVINSHDENVKKFKNELRPFIESKFKEEGIMSSFLIYESTSIGYEFKSHSRRLWHRFFIDKGKRIKL